MLVCIFAPTPPPQYPMKPDAIGIQYGILAGIANILIIMVAYLTNPDLMFSYWLGTLTFLIPILLITLAALKHRQIQDGYVTFKEVFRTIFLVILIASTILIVFDYIFYNMIAPDMMERVKEFSINKLEAYREALGEQGYDAAIERIEQQDRGLRTEAMSLVFFIIFYSLIGLIVAAIVKRKKPLALHDTLN
jgi:hypothetical protein